MTISTVTVQATPESQPSTPHWMGEGAACAHILSQTGILAAITDQVRFARARLGTDDLIDCVVVLIGYALSGEPTVQAFDARLVPCANECLALFGRNQLPTRSALSRFVAALDQASVEHVRTLFQHDLFARHPFADPGGITDRCGQGWFIADVDGTRNVVRQRALPHTESFPAPHRRCEQVCAKGHQGRTRGDVVRPRTVVLQAQTHQLLGTFGGAGNGDDRGELLRALAVLTQYATQVTIPPERILVRLDGLSGNAAPLFDVLAAHVGVLARHTDDQVLDLPAVHVILAGPPAAVCTHPESQMTRALFDCPDVPLSPAGPRVRVLVATSPATADSPTGGERRAEMVDEVFVSTVPAPAFSANDVVDLSLHRGSFETVLSDEDEEHDADRWVSRTPCGQECVQILAQWLWNLRLELGQHLAPTAVRTTECAPAHVVSPIAPSEPAAPVISGPPQWAKRSCTGGFPGSAFPLQPDGSLRCPADRPLDAHERRPEHDGSLRVLSAGRIGFCRDCSLREQCHEHPSTTKPRRVSAVFWPLPADPLAPPAPPASPALPLPAPSPLFWCDWPRRSLRRRFFPLMRRETATFFWLPSSPPEPPVAPADPVLTREQRAHSRLSWSQRLARNARPTDAPRQTMQEDGQPGSFFETFGSPAQAAASRSFSPSRTTSPMHIELDGSSFSKNISFLVTLVLFPAGFFLPSSS